MVQNNTRGRGSGRAGRGRGRGGRGGVLCGTEHRLATGKYVYKPPPKPKPKDRVEHIALTEEMEKQMGLLSETVDGLTGAVVPVRKKLKRPTHMANSDIARGLSSTSDLVVNASNKMQEVEGKLEHFFQNQHKYNLSKEKTDKRRFKSSVRAVSSSSNSLFNSLKDWLSVNLPSMVEESVRAALLGDSGVFTGVSPIKMTLNIPRQTSVLNYSTSFSRTPLKENATVGPQGTSLGLESILSGAERMVNNGRFDPQTNLNPEEVEELTRDAETEDVINTLGALTPATVHQQNDSELCDRGDGKLIVASKYEMTVR